MTAAKATIGQLDCGLGEKRKAMEIDEEKVEVNLEHEEIILKDEPYVFLNI